MMTRAIVFWILILCSSKFFLRMKPGTIFLVSILILLYFNSARSQDTSDMKRKLEPLRNNFALAIHGGAGNIIHRNLTPEQQQQYKDKMSEALRAGYAILDNGGKSMEAVNPGSGFGKNRFTEK